MMVLEFTCHDESAFTRIGKNCKEVKWKLGAMGTQPLEIQLHVEKLPGMAQEVSIHCNGSKLFPLGSKPKEKLKSDFQQKWPFRGVAKGIDRENFFEVQPKGSTDWYPAFRVMPRRDGSGQFQARVWYPQPDGAKPKEVDLPAVEKESIRELESKKPLEIPERHLVLDVPKDNPLKESTLSLIDNKGSEDVTHFFARPTPPCLELETMPGLNEVTMEVNKERTLVTVGAGHDKLVQYLASEVRALAANPESKTKMVWGIQIGGQVEHTISIEKKYKSSKIVTLAVDGKVLVEASAADFDVDAPDFDTTSGTSSATTGEGGLWTCSFGLIGQRSVKAKVFEQNKDGFMLDSTDVLEVLPRDSLKYTRICRVTIQDQKDLRTAAFDVDGIEFGLLKQASGSDEPGLKVEPEVLQMQYGLTMPTKVKDVPPTVLQAMQIKFKEAQPGLKDFGNKVGETLGNLFKG